MSFRPAGFRQAQADAIEDIATDVPYLTTSKLLHLLVHAEIDIATNPVICNAPKREAWRKAVDALRAELDYRIPKERP